MKKFVFPVLYSFICCAFVFAQDLTVRDIMREPSLAGLRPTSEKISPDGTKVVFSWNADGREPRDLYVWTLGELRILVNAEKNFEQRSVPPEGNLTYGLTVRDDFVKAREKNLFGAEFSPDSRRILFLQNSDIYVLDLDRSTAGPRRITRTQGTESSARWLTNDSILFSSGGNFFVLNINETSLVQVTKEANPAGFISIFNTTPSDDGKLLAYVVSNGSRQRALFVPDYLSDFVTAPITRRGWTDQKVFVSPTDGSLEKPFEIKLPKAEGVSYFRSMKWAADRRSLIIDRVDKDTKRRTVFYVYNAGSKAEKIITVTEETDEKWIAGLSRIIEPNPKDASQIFFGSERDGFNHLYLAALERAEAEPNPSGEIRQETPGDPGFTGKVQIRQLTTGKFEVDFAKWRETRDEIVLSSTERSTAERQFFIVNARSGARSEIPFKEKGMRTDAQLVNSGSATYLLFRYSRWNQPDEIYLQRVCPECRGLNVEQRLTTSTPEEFKKLSWSEPKFIDIPSRDGKVIKSKVYLPTDFSRTKDKQAFPMVIFVHGAGYLQNTINGWNNYYREFMFNDLLTRRGYVVLDIDYRGSAGYGREWRTDVHDFLGGKDFEDHLDAIDFMVKNYAVDAGKIGVYGGSYGGFMAGMLVTRAPHKIAAAAALRPVFDWKNYYASSNIYTTERLGFPDKNPDAYKRSSPITYAADLQKPLLILHGLVDSNVPAQDSIQMIEKLIRLEKTQYFDAMLYPSENHGFTRPTSWADEYERILSFFEKHLK